LTITTGKKVGRPSKAGERRQEILDAMVAVVAREGLADTTMAKVAEAAGMQRTLVLHYFRDRDALRAAFIGEAVAAYGEWMLPAGAEGSLEDRVCRLFEPGAYRDPADLVVWSELVALAARDGEVRRQLHDLWTRLWLPRVEGLLAAEYDTAGPDQVAATAYALAALVEAHWAFHLQGVSGPARRRQLQDAARALLAQLGR
jgi:AcrR family transcriptional regulator